MFNSIYKSKKKTLKIIKKPKSANKREGATTETSSESAFAIAILIKKI
jgi:hypothetical protein